MKKQVKIVTFCTAKSIGSILQSFALETVLNDCGYESAVCLENRKHTAPKTAAQRVKNILRRIKKLPVSKRIDSALNKRTAFIESRMQVERLADYASFEQAANENPNAVYLAGSDQVWNPDRCDPVLFLAFAKNNKRISYAASMGKTAIAPEKEEKIADWLSGYERISVRENDCADVLSKLTPQTVDVHIDPTLLLSVETWRGLERPYPVKQPYILLYMLYWDKTCKEKIKALKKRTGLPVYAICPDVSGVWADRYLYDVGIEEFLWLIDHAQYVVTSSFHGVALSIRFQKQFAAVVNRKLPSRINHILEVLSVPYVDIDALDKAERFSYDQIGERIEKERYRSVEYLKEAIGS